MIRVLAAVILASCATPLTIECTSRCGTRVVALEPEGYLPGVETGWTFEGLQMAEDKFLMLVKDQYPNACEALNVDLAFHDAPWWDWYPGRAVAGLTHCGPKLVELSNKPIYQSAYAHEMLHVLQGCKGHDGWDTNGFNDIINDWQRGMLW